MFNFSAKIQTGPRDNHHILIKQKRPQLHLRYNPACPLCTKVYVFFHETHKQDVTVEQVEECDLQLHLLNGPNVTLPKIHSRDTTPLAVQRRLQQAFCSKEPLPLRQHQVDLVHHFESVDFTQRTELGFLVYWAMGSGKSRGVLEVLMRRRARRVVIVAYNTLLKYWADTADALLLRGEDNTQMLIEVVGFTEFRTFELADLATVDCIVVDECQHFKNQTPSMEYDMVLLQAARNVILLSGTPLTNDEDDWYGLAALMRVPRSSSNTLPTPKALQKLLHHRVSYFDPRIHRPQMFAAHFPTATEVTVRVPMTGAQTVEYLTARSSAIRVGRLTVQTPNRNTYNCRTRAVCNASTFDPTVHPKLDQVVALVNAPETVWPQTVHCPHIESGVELLLEALQRTLPAHRTVGVITGKTPTAEREGMRLKYNTGKLDLLIITRASSSGLDLLKTGTMHLVEVHDNLQEENQTKNRVARLRSHEACAVRNVHYIKYLSVFPPLAEAQAAAVAVLRRWLPEVTVAEAHEYVKRGYNDENGCTIEEQMEARNITKHAALLPFLTALQKASIPMTVQTDLVTLDEDDTAAGRVLDGVEQKKRPSKRKLTSGDTTSVEPWVNLAQFRARSLLPPPKRVRLDVQKKSITLDPQVVQRIAKMLS